MPRTGDALRAVLAALILAAAPAAWPKQRVMRVLDWRSGLPVSFVGGIEQDRDGFLWITTWAGVFRYDGTEMLLQTGPNEGLVRGSATAGAPLLMRPIDDHFELRKIGGAAVAMPDGGRFELQSSAACVANDGALWVTDGSALRRRAPDGIWTGPFPLPPGAELHANPQAGRDGSVLVPCRDAVYRTDAAGRIERVAAVPGAIQVLDRSDGSTVIGSFLVDGGHVYEVRDGTTREIDRSVMRLMALAERASVLWVAYDNYLVRIAGAEPRETITFADGLPSGGEMLVDREGSLWIATYRGLVQFPEPESVSWQPEAPVIGRHVIENRGVIWMSSWGGLYRAQLEPTGWTLEREPFGHINAPCADRSGTVWAGRVGFTGVTPNGPQRRTLAGQFVEAGECSRSANGGVWFPTASGVFLLEPGDRGVRCVVPAESDSSVFSQVYEDPHGSLWGARTGEVCSTAAAGIRTGGPVEWTCLKAAAGRQITGLAEMESGAMWATTFGAGVWRLRDNRWEPIPAAADLASTWTGGLVPSPSGGVWITGEGNFLRVRERADLPEGWEVLERVGLWQGLPTSGVADVAESRDGTLWVATNMSLVRIPPQARRARPEPPPVALVEASVDGRRLEVAPGRAIELPYRRNRLELRFAALSYREPKLIRYHTRLKPTEPWSAPTKQPFFRFVDLPSGRYSVEVEASLDGERWSRAARAVTFEVLRPWYRTWWFFSLLAGSLAGGLALAYRLRVAYLLRLEHQRMRIAMDLHDEVGSGLGSIGVLAGILARPGLPDAQRADLSTRVSGVTRELSQSLGDIVWSLRAGSGNLDSLWAKVLDRARPLFATGSPQLRVEAPDPVPRVPLSLAVRRNVSLMAIEALHNAARHAGASTIGLTLKADGEGWSIEIADDGRGFLEDRSGDATRRGLGLEGMKVRAEEMGGSVAWETPASGGTTVVIRFRAGKG